MKQKQLLLDSKTFKKQMIFGGSLLKNSHAKSARPFNSAKAMHLVLRSTKAKGKNSFHSSQNHKLINLLVYARARRYGVRIYEYANSGNHLHILARFKNIYVYRSFIKSISGIIAMKVGGGKKGSELKEKFWDQRPFSRIVNWNQTYKIAKDYVTLNFIESYGFSAAASRIRDPVTISRSPKLYFDLS
jgi:REP element-mobilizing transposase RayT